MSAPNGMRQVHARVVGIPFWGSNALYFSCRGSFEDFLRENDNTKLPENLYVKYKIFIPFIDIKLV